MHCPSARSDHCVSTMHIITPKCRTIGLGMLADVFPKERLGVVMGTVLTAHTFGFAVGPPLAGWILEYWGYAVPFYVCAAIATVNFLAIVWIAEPEKHGGMKAAIREQEDQLIADEEQPTERTPLVQQHAESKPSIGMVGLMKNWKITSCVLCVMVSASVFSGIEPALPIYLRDEYGASSSTTGCKSICHTFVFCLMTLLLAYG
jgi:DHA1 family solute carrier family 18 vesicular amine transporter 1/2